MILSSEENPASIGVNITGTITSISGDVVGRDKIIYQSFDPETLINRLRAEGFLQRTQLDNVTEDTLRGLARAVTGDEPMDLPQAVREIEQAVSVASEIIKWRRTDEKQDDIVNTTLGRVADKIQLGDADGAAALIDAALNMSTELMRNSRVTLLEAGVSVSLLRRDAGEAARQFVSYLEAKFISKLDQWTAFGTLTRQWLLEAELKGTNLSAKVAGESALIMSEKASNRVERMEAATISGLSLMLLGKRDEDTRRLHLAVDAFKTALSEAIETRNTFGIAEQKIHLGQGLLYRSARKDGIRDLEDAASILKEAIEDFSGLRSFNQIWLRSLLFIGGKRDATHRSWARAQVTLGQVLWRLAVHRNSRKLASEAERAFLEGLKVYKQDSDPLEWADIQCNLGNIWLLCSQGEASTASLKKAIGRFAEANKEWTREKTPGVWASMNSNLAYALESLGTRTGERIQLDAAVSAYKSALEVRPPVRSVSEFAADYYKLGRTLFKLAAQTSDGRYLQESQLNFKAAQSLISKEADAVSWAQASGMLAASAALIARECADLRRIDEAIAQLEIAIPVLRQAGADPDLTFIEAQLLEHRHVAAAMRSSG